MQTVCALSTPRGIGGIAVIRVSGDTAREICNTVLSADLTAATPNRACFARVVENGETVDEVMYTYFAAPRSFTGEDTVEISCHGGMYTVERILSLLLAHGAAPAGPGEFTKRAFLNGKLDLNQAEAVIDLIHSQSRLQARAALGQLDGHLSRKSEAIRQILMQIATEIMAYVDYPEETIGEIDEGSIAERLRRCEADLERLHRSFAVGQVIKEGIPTVILGRPNVGKSTLMNALLGRDKSIVTDIAGTTRDLVEDSAVLGDVVLHLIDTAGIRQTDDTVERIGVERAKSAISSAKLVLLVTDGSMPLTKEDTDILALCEGIPTVILRNKSDIAVDAAPIEAPYVLSLSAKNETGLDELAALIRSLFLGEEFDESETVLTNLRQQHAVLSALESVRSCTAALDAGISPDLIGLDVEAAAQSLGELVGVSVHEQMIDDIFSRFCVGK